MTVKITKPAMNLREELAALHHPTSIAGLALLKADSVQEQRDLLGSCRKNLIINGRGFVDQRELSGESMDDEEYSLDRWFVRGDRGINVTQIDGGGIKIGCPLADAWAYIGQKIEDCYSTIGTKSFTVSFDMKWNNHPATTRNSMVFLQWVKDDGNVTGDFHVAYLDGIGKNGWAKFSTTVTLKDSGTDPKHLWLGIYGSRSTAVAWEMEIDNVQIELGSVATEFEHRSYGEELHLCQRYFQRINGSCVVASACASSSQAARIALPLKVTMRDDPDMSYSDIGGLYLRNAGGSSKALTQTTSFSSTTDFVDFTGTIGTADLVAGNAAQFRLTTGEYIDFDAELN